jgi:hypothetical protein
MAQNRAQPGEKPNAIKANALIPRPTTQRPASGTNPANNRYFADLGSREQVAEL